MTKTSKLLSTISAAVVCVSLLSGCSGKDRDDFSNSFFPHGVEAYDAQVAEWKFQREERRRIRREEEARRKAEREAAKQARIARKQKEAAEFYENKPGKIPANRVKIDGEADVSSSSMEVEPVAMGALDAQPQPVEPASDSMIPLEAGAQNNNTVVLYPSGESTVAEEPILEEQALSEDVTSDGANYDDVSDSGSQNSLIPMDEDPSVGAEPVSLTPMPEETAIESQKPDYGLSLEGSITPEEFERLQKEREMQRQYMEMRENQLTVHPFIYSEEGSVSSIKVIRSGAAPMMLKPAGRDDLPAVEVFPLGKTEAAPVSVLHEKAGYGSESVFVFPLDAPYYDTHVPELLPLTPTAGMRGQTATKTTSGLKKPEVSYNRPVNRPVAISSRASMAKMIYFSHGAKRMAAKDQVRVKNLAAQILKSSPMIVRIIGHASKRSGKKNAIERHINNYHVSLDRAGHVAEVLMRAGIPAEWLEVSAYGDTVPNKAKGGKDQEAADRRVEILVYQAK